MKTFLPESLKWLLPILLFASFQTNAENLFVNASGNNTSNDCKNSASPCKTIEYALTQAAPGDVITATGNLTTEPMPLIITKPITLRGAQADTKPVLAAISPFAPEDRVSETRLRFIAVGRYILIKDGVNDVTIEGFEFFNTIDDATQAIIMFETGSAGNNNITIRRNILNGNSTTRRRLIFKDNTGGDLTNIKIIENRILGLGDFPNAAIDIRKAGAGTNEIRGNVIGTPSNATTYLVQKGINLSNVTDFTIAQNEFRSIIASPIEIESTNPGGNIIIEFNNFISSNSGGFINESGPNSPIAAGILLRANTINSTSFIIRNNDFQGNNKFAIAIPTANNNFTTNSIRIVENRFSISNAIGSNSVADVYTGNNMVNPAGKIYTDGNYWGTNSSPLQTIATVGATPGGSINADILGGTNAISKVSPTLWLLNSTDIGDNAGTVPGFISNKIVTFNGNPSGLQSAFNVIPENWTFKIPESTTGTYPGPDTIKNSFVFDAPSENIAFGNLTINAPGKIISLNKTLSICTTCNGTSTGSLTLIAGKIKLGAYNIYIKDKATIVANNAESYIITNGTGKLIQTGIGSNKTGIINFPVGPDETSFTPATINNSGTTDDFSVSVVRGISRPGNNGAPVTENAVNLTWNISEDTPGGSNVTLTLQWNAGDPVSMEANDEQQDFDPTLSYITHYNSTSSTWENLEWPGSPAEEDRAGTILARKKTAIGVNNFSPFGVGGPNAPLPVDLINFSAKIQDINVELSWTTASEKDNAYFAIERSVDGKNFNEIGKLHGQGTVDGFNTYNFTDSFATETGHNSLYYRLKQVDTNGKFMYSKIQHVQLETWAVSLFPNPAHQFVKISSSGKTLVEVMNNQGQILIQKEFTSNATLNLSSLVKGMYIFRFYNGQQILSKKLSVL